MVSADHKVRSMSLIWISFMIFHCWNVFFLNFYYTLPPMVDTDRKGRNKSLIWFSFFMIFLPLLEFWNFSFSIIPSPLWLTLTIRDGVSCWYEFQFLWHSIPGIFKFQFFYYSLPPMVGTNQKGWSKLLIWISSFMIFHCWNFSIIPSSLWLVPTIRDGVCRWSKFYFYDIPLLEF